MPACPNCGSDLVVMFKGDYHTCGKCMQPYHNKPAEASTLAPNSPADTSGATEVVKPTGWQPEFSTAAVANWLPRVRYKPKVTPPLSDFSVRNRGKLAKKLRGGSQCDPT